MTAAADLLALTKPRIVAMVVVTVAAGFVLALAAAAAAPPAAAAVLLGHTLLGTALVAAGTNALNQLFERDVDARMERTRQRPLPAGRLTVAAAAAFAWAAGVIGILYLAVSVNLLTAALAAATLGTYAFLYTPLKRRTSLATLVGAVPGALPIVGGWTAAGGSLSLEAWVLFAILFLWQLPHFLALAWIYREDYRRAGLQMLTVTDGDGGTTFRHAALYAAALIPVSLAPAVLQLTGPLYFAGALLLSGWFTWVAAGAALATSQRTARRLFLVSLVYLPALLTLMVLSRPA